MRPPCWRVQWCVTQGFVGKEACPDLDHYKDATFDTAGEARQYARRMAPQAVYGCAIVQCRRLTGYGDGGPPGWENVGEPEYIEAGEEMQHDAQQG